MLKVTSPKWMQSRFGQVTLKLYAIDSHPKSRSIQSSSDETFCSLYLITFTFLLSHGGALTYKTRIQWELRLSMNIDGYELKWNGSEIFIYREISNFF